MNRIFASYFGRFAVTITNAAKKNLKSIYTRPTEQCITVGIVSNTFAAWCIVKNQSLSKSQRIGMKYLAQSCVFVECRSNVSVSCRKSTKDILA